VRDARFCVCVIEKGNKGGKDGLGPKRSPLFGTEKELKEKGAFAAKDRASSLHIDSPERAGGWNNEEFNQTTRRVQPRGPSLVYFGRDRCPVDTVDTAYRQAQNLETLRR